MSGTGQLNEAQKAQIAAQWQEKTAQKLAAELGVTVHAVRNYCYSQGWYKMRLEYWTAEQVEFLLEHYREIGDKELAMIYQDLWPKEKGWTLKHIEKKRNQLKLKRSAEELAAIKQRNLDRGCWEEAYIKRWKTRGQAPEGEIRWWYPNGSPAPYIKIKGRWLRWNRYRWEQLHGPVDKGMNVVFKDRNPFHLSDDNLILITDGELSKRNAEIGSMVLSDNYVAGMMVQGSAELREIIKRDHPELIQIKRLQLTLNRKIHDKL